MSEIIKKEEICEIWEGNKNSEGEMVWFHSKSKKKIAEYYKKVLELLNSKIELKIKKERDHESYELEKGNKIIYLCKKEDRSSYNDLVLSIINALCEGKTELVIDGEKTKLI